MHDWLRPSMIHPWARGSNIPGNKAAQRRGHMDKQTGSKGQKGRLTNNSYLSKSDRTAQYRSD